MYVNGLQTSVSVVRILAFKHQHAQCGLLAEPEVADLVTLAAWHVRCKARIVCDNLEIGICNGTSLTRELGALEAEQSVPRRGTREFTAIFYIGPGLWRVHEISKGIAINILESSVNKFVNWLQVRSVRIDSKQ